MIYWILILSAAVFAAFQLVKIQNKLAFTITCVQILGILLSLVGNFGFDSIINVSWGLYLISLCTVLFYSISCLKSHKRTWLFILTMPILLTNVFQFFHFPGAGWLGIICLLSIGVYFWVLAHRRHYANEFAFLTIMAADALIIFLLRIPWLFEKL